MKKIKIAQIGTSANSHGREIFATIAAMNEIFEIVGYALPENERERFPDKMSIFEGYREMSVDEILNDPTIEAVTIETEEIYLTKYAQMAADFGKHIHMEKPGGQSLEDFERLIDTVKKSNTVFHTGYMYRYNPAVQEICERIKNGEIGEVISVEAQMNGRHPRSVVEWLSKYDGGMMFFLGCHMIDLVMQIQGSPKKIYTFNKTTERFDDLESTDFSMAVFEYDRGASIIKACDAECGGLMRRQLVVTGTKGRFKIEPLEISISYPWQYTVYNECIDEDWNAEGTTKRSADHDRYEAMLDSFAAMVRGEKENPYSYDYELELFRTIKECCK